jgi:hypothetical protein
MGPDLGIRVRIVLAVFQARGHVEHLPHRGITKRGRSQFRHVVPDVPVGIDAALLNQHRPQRADH